MSKKKTTKKTSRNGNGSKRRNGNGHNGNGTKRKSNNGNGGNGRARARSPTKRQKPAMIVHRPESLVRAPRSRSVPVDERPSLAQRVDEMGATHVGAAAAAGAVASALAVTAVAKGWVQPKTSAGILLTAGAATSAAGWHLERDHLMMAGAGVTVAGAFSMANQLSSDAYDKLEERAEKRREKKAAEEAEKDKAKKLAEAKAILAEAEKEKAKGGRRNAQRILILQDDQDSEDESDYATREAGNDDYQDDEQAA